MDQRVASRIRTIWFLFAMIPVAVFTALLGLLSLVLCSPLMIYATVVGKHLKDPWSKKRIPSA
jgi:hypothetical protein